MKSLFTALSCIILTNLFGQITVGNNIIPAVGDIYHYAIDTLASNVKVSPSGGNQFWDFSQLVAHRAQSESYVLPSSIQGSSSFPTSNLASSRQGQNLFFKTTTKNLELLGTFSVGNPLFGGANVFDKPAVIIRTPIDYQDTYDYTTNTQIAISGAFIPDSLTMGLKVDSIRVKIKQDVKVEIDGWGMLKLHTSQYEVLRQKRTTTTGISVEAKVPILGWFDVTQLASGFFGQFLGSGKSTQYSFISNTSKGEIVSFGVDTLGRIGQVSFKSSLINTENPELELQAIEIKSNPVQSSLTLNCRKLSTGNYAVEQYNATGSLLSSEKKFLTNGSSSTLYVDNLTPGKYELIVRSNTGSIIWRGSFLKI